MKHLFLIILICLVTISFTEAQNTKKVNKEYQKRNEECLREQEHQQKSNIKHYRKNCKYSKTAGKNLHKS